MASGLVWGLGCAHGRLPRHPRRADRSPPHRHPLRPHPGAGSGLGASSDRFHRGQRPAGTAHRGSRRCAAGVGGRLPALGGARAPGLRHRRVRGVAVRPGRGAGAGAGTPSGAPLPAHRAGLGAGGDAGRGDESACPGRLRGQGPQLGEPAPGAALGVVRAVAGGAARGGALHLGGQPGLRAVGARQRHRCPGPSGPAAPRAALDPGAGHLAGALPPGQPHGARAPARPSALVHPEPGGRGGPCGSTPGPRRAVAGAARAGRPDAQATAP
jgi:hypothetical protein